MPPVSRTDLSPFVAEPLLHEKQEQLKQDTKGFIEACDAYAEWDRDW